MKGISFWALLCAFMAMVPAPGVLAQAQSAEPPAWTVDDTWTRRWPNGKEYVWTVVSVTDDAYIVKDEFPDGSQILLQFPRNQAINTTAPQWWATDPIAPVQKLQWPLEIGKGWTVPSFEGGYIFRTTWKVERIESVTVPAGTFQTFKITGTKCQQMSNVCGQLWMWYSPDVKNVVRGLWDNTRFWPEVQRGRSWDLVQYKLH